MHVHTVYGLSGHIVYCHFTISYVDFLAFCIKNSIHCNVSIFCNYRPYKKK